VVTLAPGEFRDVFWSKPLDQLWALGPRTLLSLRDLGMATIGDLAQTEVETLAPFFGTRARSLIELAHGRSSGEVACFEGPRGPFLSRGVAYDSPVGVRPRLHRQVERLCEQLAEALATERRTTRRLELAVAWEDFTETTRRARLEEPTLEAAELVRWAEALFRRFDLGAPVRRIEVVAADIAPVTAPGTTAQFALASAPATAPVLPDPPARRASAA
jgi:DNA polymerase-4